MLEYSAEPCIQSTVRDMVQRSIYSFDSSATGRGGGEGGGVMQRSIA